MNDWFNLDQVAFSLEVFNQLLTAVKAVHAGVLARLVVHGPVIVHHVDPRQVMPVANFKVVRVVGGSDLHQTGPEFRVDVLVFNDRDFPANQRQNQLLAHQVLVAFIPWGNSHGRVTKHGFRPGSSNFHAARAVSQRVVDVVEGPLVILVDNLDVRQSRPQLRVPVDDIFAPVDQAFIIELNENPADSLGQALVKSEAFPAVVQGQTQLLPLALDDVGVFVLPFPDLFHELFPAQVIAADPLFTQAGFNLGLGGDAGVVHAWQVKGVVALHPLIADQGVLNCRVPGVAQVQLASNVWRRDND